MRICITGIAGFIGSTLATRLVELGHEVTGFDSLAWGFPEDVPEECEWAMADLLHLDRWGKGEPTLAGADNALGRMRMEQVFGGVDLVIHCAANIEVLSSLSEPTSDLRVNTEGTVELLEAMRAWGIGHLINFSSACVYGKGSAAMSPSAEVDARSDTPNWPYGVSKLCAEAYCNYYASTGEVKVFNFRPGIVCGPREWYGRALTIMLKRALEGEKIVVFVDPDYKDRRSETKTWADGTPTRDFVHIDDVVNQVLCTLVDFPKRFPLFARTINMGLGSRYSIMQLAKAVSKQTDAEIVKEAVQPGKFSELVQGRIRLPQEMLGMCLDMSLAKTALGHVPVHSTLTRIVTDELAWLTEQGGLERWKSAGMKV